MSSEIRNKLYDMEVAPPQKVWEHLSNMLDEINEDNKIAEKMLNSQADPGPYMWEKINKSLEQNTGTEISKPQGFIITIKRFTAAAAIIGIIAVSYYLFFYKKSGQNEIVVSGPVQNAEQQNPGDNNFSDTVNDVPESGLAKTDDSRNTGEALIPYTNYRSGISFAAVKRLETGVPVQLASLHDPFNVTDGLGKKIFNQPIDDLSMIASGDRYLTMVSADGRLVKIPARFSNLASYMQEKSSEIEYMDILFEESVYWKEKIREWREKLAQSPVTPSMDNFFDIIGLLQSIQEN